MSLDIDWSLLSTPAGPSTSTNGNGNAEAGPSKPKAGNDANGIPNGNHPSVETLTSHLISVLNTQLATTKRPSFIGPIEITQFDFGSSAPEVEIKDIRDVWRAFDQEDDDDDEEEYGDGQYDGQEVLYDEHDEDDRSRQRRRSSDNPAGIGSNGHYYDMMSPGGMGEMVSASRLPSVVDWDDTASVFSSNRRQSLHAVGLGARGLGVPSMGIHGRGDYLAAPSVLSHPFSPGGMSTRHPPAPTHTYMSHPPSPARAPAKPAPTSSSSIPSLQLHLNLSHTSDLTLTLLTSLIVNYPSSVFMSLPLKLSITGLQLAADFVVAFDGDKKRVHITIVDDGGDSDHHHHHHHHNGTASHLDGGAGVPIGQRLLPEMRIDSEIGHSDAHVLRNVGKVERFIADVVRKTLVDELVFPNFHTIAL